MTDSGIATFIGGGNMARSLIGGLLRQGAPASSIRVAEPNADCRAALARDFQVAVFSDNLEAVRGARAWVLAVKPQVAREVCEPLAPAARAGPLVVSIMAGIGLASLSGWLGRDAAIVRCMPNTPALIGAGITGLCAAASVGLAERDRAMALLAGAGETVWIEDERHMDAVTAVSGSGPAYVFLFAEAMMAAAQAQGLPAPVAHILVNQTLLGASRMLAEAGEDPGLLRRRVTSPGGTTEAAVNFLASGRLDALLAGAVDAATRRSRALSVEGDG